MDVCLRAIAQGHTYLARRRGNSSLVRENNAGVLGGSASNRPHYFTAIVTPTVVTVDVWPLVVAITDSGKKRKAPCA